MDEKPMTYEQEYKEVMRAAAVIKAACVRRTEDDSCRTCPFWGLCDTEPYTWEIEA